MTATPTATLRSLPTKLSIHEDLAPDALDWLIEFLREERQAVLALAAGRHAWGHFRYGDSLMYEYDSDRLLSEAMEEIADAVVYLARRMELG